MCQKVYFPTEDYSRAFETVVNAGLWKLFNNFEDRDLYQHRIDKQDFEDARLACKNNLDETARSTPLLLDHSYIQIQALLLLVSPPSSKRRIVH